MPIRRSSSVSCLKGPRCQASVAESLIALPPARQRGVRMQTAAQCHQYARDCVRWAARSRTEEQRKGFLERAPICARLIHLALFEEAWHLSKSLRRLWRFGHTNSIAVPGLATGREFRLWALLTQPDLIQKDDEPRRHSLAAQPARGELLMRARHVTRWK